MHTSFFSKKSGFTLIETLVGAAVFLMISTAAYQAYVSLFKLISQNQYKINALNLANEQFEIARNMPYADIGIQGGIPNGKLAHLQTVTRGNIPFLVTTTVRNVDQAFDGILGGSPNDLSPADNKLVEIEVSCPTCEYNSPIVLSTNVAPKGLETASTNGALFIKVFNSNGVPVENAGVHVVNNQVSPPIVIDDITDSNGMLQIVDAPPGNEAYEITVTKTGYSTDRTYTTGDTTNPNPTKPHATVLLQALTQTSFSIDELSSLSFRSVTPQCLAVGNIDFSLIGSKTIGAGIPKYSANLSTNGSGTYTDSSVEWDFYSVLNRDTEYDIIGLNPLNPISVNPNTTQQVSMIVTEKNGRSLLVTVKDNATKLPITGAQVKITKDTFTDTKITGRGAIIQTNWSGGRGQGNFIDTTKYYSDGNVVTDSPSGEVKLKDDGFGTYSDTGELESSTIDTGSPSNFYNLTWSPTDQPVPAGENSVKFQFASNVFLGATTTWTYKGPDGATSTYYTIPNTPLAAVHNGDRYARYKIYLSTENTTAATPNISDVAFTVTSECTPPGQVVFSGLETGTYNIEVTISGYTTLISTLDITGSWQEQEFLMLTE
jgi:prepilin-type N-terminal cleavage/methylation domain-containing protein